MKKTTPNWNEPADKQGDKKAYLKRILEQQEAEEEINEYLTNERNPDRVPPNGVKKYDRK